MAIANELQAPDWISSGAKITGGLDLLGLRLPVQFIGGTLLDGVTTVSPSVRYIALRAWLISRYGQSGLPDSWTTFTEFAARLESVLVLGNLIQDRSIGGLIGAEQAADRLDANTPTLSTAPLVITPAATVYAGPSDQLGVSRARGDAVPGLIAERGIPLASIVDRQLSGIPLIQHLLARPDLDAVSLDGLAELGEAVRIDRIPDDERTQLLAAIIPAKPLPQERSRIGTYASLLALASKLKARPTENDLLNSACSMGRFGEPLLDQIADGWTTYCVRDTIAVTQEAVLAAIMDEIQATPDGGLSGVEQSRIVAALLERVEEHSTALRDLDLLNDCESVSDLTYRELCRRVEARVSSGSEMKHGIRRWSSDLIEPRIYKLALKSGAGALTLAVVAWILVEIRVGDGARESGEKDESHLSYQGGRRMGLRNVILPELERFYREDRSVREVAADLAYRVVHQHLQIAWSRLQADLTRDVSLLTSEGSKWFSRGKGFAGGRTASRLQQALGWLSQLKLVDDSGITADGALELNRALAVLAEGGAT
jgi:hypothetical protein